MREIKPQDFDRYQRIHNKAIEVYEASVPAAYRYSAVALRKAVDAAILEASLTAAFSPPPEPAPSSPVPVEAVTIKPLEWSEHYRGENLRGGETVIAKTILGRYQVWGDGAWADPHEFHNPGAERGLDVGKAAAQAHFDAAVRSALCALPAAPAHREVGE